MNNYAAIILFVVMLSAAVSAAKVEQAVYQQNTDYVKVIIKAEENAAPLIASLSHDYESFNNSFFAANISKSNLAFFENSPNVKRVWLDKKNKPLLDVSVPLIQDNQTFSYNGSGVKVCVIDTGINSTHPALAGRVVAERDFVTDDNDGNSTQDGANHGTHVAGIVASNNNTYRGVAPGALILNAKVFHNYGTGWSAFDSDIMSGIDWCIVQNANVLTLSLGGGDNANDGSDALSQYLDYAVEQGKVVSVSAGNSGPSGGDSDCRTSDSTGSSFSVCSPGLSHKAITVGSVQTGKSGTARNNISGFSSRGPTKDGRIKPDIVAPGQPITSSVSNGGFVSASGTSMAAPHVAGVAALVLQARSNTTPEEFKALLMNTANGFEKNNTYGAGTVNVTRLFSEINYTLTSSIGNYSRAHNIFVPENSSEIRAVLYWPENYSYHNNLDLLLFDPSGIQRNASLSVNNTDEKIIFANPSAGYWKLVINGTYVNGTQKYSLAASAAPLSQLFLFNSTSNATSYHELNVTNTTAEIYIDWLGNATINATLYNSSGILVSSLLSTARISFSVSGENGTWTLKLIPNQTVNYSITSNNNILNHLPNSVTAINITHPRNASYFNSRNITANFSMNRRVRTAQSCSWTITASNSGGGSSPTYLFPGNQSFTITFNDTSIEHGLNVTCTDDNGVSSSASISFFTDMTAPSFTINAGDINDAYVRRNHTFVNITVDETNAFRCFLEWDNVNETMNLSSNYCFINKSSSEGFHSYKIYVNDSASNAAFIGRNVTFDLTAPQANVTFSGARENIFSPNDDGFYDEININVTASEIVNFSTTYIVAQNGSRVKTFTTVKNTSSILKTWNGCFIESCASGLVPDGVYKIEVKMTDRAGNVNATNLTQTVTVDTMFIEMSFVNAPKNTVVNTTDTVVINVTTSDVPSSMLLEWNGTNESMNGSGLSWFKVKTKLSDGNYTFRINATDSFGNTNSTEIRQVFINTTRNLTSAISNINQSLLSKNIGFVFLNSTGHEIDSSRLLSFENYTLRFRIKNISVETADFTPDLLSSSVLNITDNVTSETNISSAFNRSGGLLDGYVWIDLNEMLPAGNFTAKITFPKIYSLYFYLNGTSNNVTAIRVNNTCNSSASNKPCYNLSANSSTLFLPSFSGGAGGNDTAAPPLAVSSPTATTYSSSNVSLTYTVSDNVAVDKCWHKLNSGSNTTINSCANTTITASSGSNTLVLYANDSSGNTNQTSITFTYTPPPSPPPSSSSSSSSSSSGSPAPATNTTRNNTANQTNLLNTTTTVNQTVNATTPPQENENTTANKTTAPTGQVVANPSYNIADLAVVFAAAVIVAGALLYLRKPKTVKKKHMPKV